MSVGPANWGRIATATLTLESVSKTLGDNRVLSNVSLSVEDKEFVVILGPSGSGKTTTLRCIAGLERVDKGTIRVDGKVINDLSPKDRDMAMVFQNYAIYPTMKVRDNIGFPLRVRHMPREEIQKKVNQVAELLRIPNLLDRKPSQLSGGERQRVAVARALIREPKLFLMDEPLSNLDAKLRMEARTEIKKLQHQLGITTIFVTHDQAEALALADRIAIMDKGEIQQMGTPDEIYNQPSSVMVAGFVGSPSMNFIDARLVRREDGSLVLESGEFVVDAPSGLKLDGGKSHDVIIGFRPEDGVFTEGSVSSTRTFPAEIYEVEPMGTHTILTLKSISLIKITVSRDVRLSPGLKGVVAIKSGTIKVFDKATGKLL